MPLNLNSNIADVDGFYQELIDSQRDCDRALVIKKKIRAFNILGGADCSFGGQRRDLGGLSGFGSAFGIADRRLRGEDGCFVSADQKPYLDSGNDDESGREVGQGFRIVRDLFLGRFWPYYLAGAITGALMVGLMLWLNRDYPKLPGTGRDQERK